MSTETPSPSQLRAMPRKRRIVLSALLWLTALAPLPLAVIYRTRADALASITVFPVWIWAAPAMLVLVLTVRFAPWRTAIVLLIWLAYLGGCAEEPVMLVRGLVTRPLKARDEAARVRVISFNCGGVNTTAELAPFQPDVVLLQEAPSREAVERFAAELFADSAVVWSADAVIVADGELLSPPDWHAAGDCFVRARVRLRRGPTLEIVSLRLLPPLVRLDLWSPDCWAAQTENRRQRRAQLVDLLARWRGEQGDYPLILGGDFNAPAGDAAMDVAGPAFREAGARAGRGWCNTITNEFPVLRIDQVWTNPRLEPIDVTAHRSRGSDHRFVVCDLELRPGS